MQRWYLLAIFCLVRPGWVVAADFNLSQIKKDFPSDGFEDKIRFWQRIFTEFGEKDIAFHDRNDVRLIYAVVSVDRAVENDPGEARRQRDLLNRKRAELEKIIDDLKKGDRPSPKHTEITRLLRRLGYEPSRDLFENLHDNIRYQRGVKEKFLEGLIRSGRYLAQMEKIFADKGLPTELALLPHIESSFRYDARSSAGASGIWQIVRSTGRSRLRINRYEDERLDPIRATEAAAQILEADYRTLGSWPLAITAYNYGSNGIRRATQEFGSDLIEVIDKLETKRFGFASKNFYAEFLAAVEVHHNRERYFGPVALEAPLQCDVMALTSSLRVKDLERQEGLTTEDLKRFNPALTRHAWRRGIIPAGFQLRVPPGKAPRVAALLEKSPSFRDSLQTDEDETLVYEVSPGDSLISIAQLFGTTVESIQKANDIQNRHRIRAGQKLLIPSASGAGKPFKYRVQKGDTVLSIAKRFGASSESILLANRIRNPDLIVPGQTLVIP